MRIRPGIVIAEAPLVTLTGHAVIRFMGRATLVAREEIRPRLSEPRRVCALGAMLQAERLTWRLPT